jgi:hypothetical protein
MAGAVLTHWAASPTTMVFGLGSSASFDTRIVGFYPHVTPAEILGEEGIIGFALFAALMILGAASARHVAAASRIDSVVPDVISSVTAMLCFVFLQSMKEGSLLGNYEVFMLCIVTCRLSASLRAGVTPSTEGQGDLLMDRNVRFSNLMR